METVLSGAVQVYLKNTFRGSLFDVCGTFIGSLMKILRLMIFGSQIACFEKYKPNVTKLKICKSRTIILKA